MNPWLVYALVGIGAYWLGKKQGVTQGIAQATSPAATTTTLPAAASVSPSSVVQSPSPGSTGAAAATSLFGTPPAGQ